MKAQYQISEDDYVRAVRLFGKFTRKQLYVYFVLAGVLVLCVLLGSPIVWAAGIGGLIGGSIAILGGRFVVSPLLARRHYRKYKAIQDKFKVELLPDGLKFSSSSSEGKLTWDKVFRWRQNESYILVYLMPRLFHILPKSVANNGFNVSELTNRLLENVGPET